MQQAAATDARGDAAPAPSPTSGWRRSFLNLLAGEVIGGLLRFVALIWVARTVGPERFGAVGAGLGLAGLLVALNSGLSIFGMRSMAADPDNGRQIAGRVLGARVVSSLLLYGMTVIGLTLAVDFGANRTIFMLFGLVVVTDALNLRWAFVGTQRTGWVAIAGWVGGLFYLGTVIALVHDPHDANIVAAAHITAEALIALVLIVVSRRRFPGWRPDASLRGWASGVRESAAMTVTTAARHALGTLDTVLITVFVSTGAAGNYAAPQRVTLIVMVVVGLLYESSLPTFVRVFATSASNGRRLVWATARRVAVIVVPGALLGTALAGPIMVLAVGDEYDSSAGLLRVLVWGVVLNTISGPFTQALWALGDQRRVAVVTVAAALTNIGLNVVLLPTVGVMGAAMADSAAKLLLLVGFVLGLEGHARRGRAQTAPDVDRLLAVSSPSDET